MITCSKIKKFNSNLTAFFQDDNIYKQFSKLQSFKKGEIIFEKKTDQLFVYVFLGNKKEITENSLKDIFFNFFKKNNLNINIKVQTFLTNIINEEKFLEIFYNSFFESEEKSFSIKKIDNKDKKEVNYNLLANENQLSKEKIQKMKIISKAREFTKKLQDMPTNLLYPDTFIKEVKEIINKKKLNQIKVKVFSEEELKKEEMNLLLAVGKGSDKNTRMLVLEYQNNPNSDKKTALIGKGITFDTGGISLKPSRALKGMKFDMSGAAIMVGATLAIAELKLKTNIITVVGLAENKIGGKATIVESVIKSKSGKWVEINNTDAEGRLILADTITYAQKQKATSIIEAATLTGAIIVALGKEHTGLFTNNKEFGKKIIASGKKVEEKIVYLPIAKERKEELKSKIADLKNVSEKPFAGSASAAAFLMEFIENNIPFVHLDIAGTADKNERGTAVLVKTIVEYFS